MRASRLIVATLLLPVAALLAYFVALLWNGDRTTIDSNGSALGLAAIVAGVFIISKIAQEERWPDRAGTAIALSCAYFMLTWTVYGDSSLSPDSSPHLVWFGLCVAAFSPTVVIIPASKWAWTWHRSRA
jgi:hypothetical protein